jgi:hypothetical protein
VTFMGMAGAPLEGRGVVNVDAIRAIEIELSARVETGWYANHLIRGKL